MNFTKLNWDMVIECDVAIDRARMQRLEQIFATSPGYFGDDTTSSILSAFEDAAKKRQYVYLAYMQQNPKQREVRICCNCGELMVGNNYGNDYDGEEWYYECSNCGYSENWHVAK